MGVGQREPKLQGSGESAMASAAACLSVGVTTRRWRRSPLWGLILVGVIGLPGCVPTTRTIVADTRFASVPAGMVNSSLALPGMIYYVDLKSRQWDRVGDLQINRDNFRPPTITSDVTYNQVSGVEVSLAGASPELVGEIEATVQSQSLLELKKLHRWYLEVPIDAIEPAFLKAAASGNDPWKFEELVGNPEAFYFVVSGGVFAESGTIYFGTPKDEKNGIDIEVPGIGAAKIVYQGGSETGFRDQGTPFLVDISWFQVRSTPTGLKFRPASLSKAQLEQVRSILRGE